MTSPTDGRAIRVCLLGAQLDGSNFGPPAMAAALVGLIRQAAPDAEITLLGSGPASGRRRVRLSCEESVEVQVVNCATRTLRPLAQSRLWTVAAAVLFRGVPIAGVRRWLRSRTPWLEAVLRADVIGDIFAGDGFSDQYGVKTLVVNAMGSLVVIWLARPLVLLPQTYGPYASPASRWIARFILRRCAGLYARDASGGPTVASVLGTGRTDRTPTFCPDVAFALPACRPSRSRIDPVVPDSEPPRPIVGVNLSGLLYGNARHSRKAFGLRCDFRQLARELPAAIVAETNARVLLVPHGLGEGDQEACEQVFDLLAREMPGRIHVVRGTFDQYEIKQIIGSCDYFIGSRLHACIASLSAGGTDHRRGLQRQVSACLRDGRPGADGPGRTDGPMQAR